MKKLDSVKKPKALVSLLLIWTFVFLVGVFLAVIALLIISYFINQKTAVGDELIAPILRVAAYVVSLYLDMALLFVAAVIISVYRLVTKKNIAIKNAFSLLELSRTTVVVFDEDEIYRGKTCVVKEVVALGKQSENEVTDIASSIAFLIKDDNPKIHAVQKLSFIPILSNSEVIKEEGYYLTNYRDKKYVLGSYGTFKYRQEEFIKNKVEPYLLKGFEILLVGSYEKDLINGKYAEFANVFGIIVLKNDVNAEYKKIVEEYQNKGIKVKILSSSSAVMASESINAIGVNNAGKYLSFNSHSEMKETEIKDSIVYGNLSKSQKGQIISILQRQGEVVTVLGTTPEARGANCFISNRKDVDADIVISNDVSPDEIIKESIYLSNKIYRMFTLLLFRTMFVGLFLVVTAGLCISGTPFNYKPIGLGVVLSLIAALSILFDKERREPPSFTILWRKVLLSFGLSATALLSFLVLYLLQRCEVVYTGINGAEPYLSMCGVVLVVGVSITVINLYLPINKRRGVILSSVVALFIGVVTLLWVLSVHLNKPLFGISFNTFNGQDNLLLAIALTIFAAAYLIINYLLDIYKERGDE